MKNHKPAVSKKTRQRTLKGALKNALYKTLIIALILSYFSPLNYTAPPARAADLIPTDTVPSPLFGAESFTQKMLLFEEFGTEAMPGGEAPNYTPLPKPVNTRKAPPGDELEEFIAQEGLSPYPTRLSNVLDENPWNSEIETFLGRELVTPVTGEGVAGPAEGRPSGEFWAHQRWEEFQPEIYFKTVQTGARVNGGFRDERQRHGYALGEFGPGGLYNEVYAEDGGTSLVGTTEGATIRFHPEMPVQDPAALWTFDGTLPPKLLNVRYGEPVLLRHYNALPIDPTANRGFGEHTITTHEHNGHQPGESDGFASAFFYPGQFYDYRWPLQLAGYDTINTDASDPRASFPCEAGETIMVDDDDDGIPTEKSCVDGRIQIRGDWRETMSTHWFHDHMLDRTSDNVYKGNAVMMNYYSALDRGNEGLNDGVNLRFPSGTELNWGNRDYDVNLLVADKAWDREGQLWFNTVNTDGFLGDHVLANWLYHPYFDVRARSYRFRILNGAVSRYFTLALVQEVEGSGGEMPGPAGSGVSYNRVGFHMIGNDGNIMEHAVPFDGSVDLDNDGDALEHKGQLPTQGIAERYDIIVDFAQNGLNPGDKLFFVNMTEHANGRGTKSKVPLADVLSEAYKAVPVDNDADGWNDEYVGGDPAVGKFLELRIKDYNGTDLSMDPAEYTAGGKKMIELSINRNDPALLSAPRQNFEFVRHEGGSIHPWQIKVNGGDAHPMDPARISALVGGQPEIFRIKSGAGWDHPVHIHFEEGIILTRDGAPPPGWEIWARKDLYRIGEDEDASHEIELTFRARDFVGVYMTHCHNTTHEDHAMLLRWDASNPDQLVRMPTPQPSWDGVAFKAAFVEGDHTAPIVTLNGPAFIEIEQNSPFVDPGVGVNDDTDLIPTLNVSGTVDASVIKTYFIIYSATDAAGNVSAVVTRTVNVVAPAQPDTTAPLISLAGKRLVVLNLGEAYADAGATAVDDTDGDLSAQITVNGLPIDTNAAGTYEVTYSVVDASGNLANAARTVLILDPAEGSNVIRSFSTNTPEAGSSLTVTLEVNLSGPDTFYLIDEIPPAGWTISDPGSGEVTAGHIKWLVLSGAASTLYQYTLTVPGSAQGTHAFAGEYAFETDGQQLLDIPGETKVNVVTTAPPTDTIPPVIHIAGGNPAQIDLNMPFDDDAGATASDNVDGDLTAAIQVTHNVNTAVAGTYAVVYTVSDAAGNTVSAVRTVQVGPPIIAVDHVHIQPEMLSLEIGGTHQLVAEANDANHALLDPQPAFNWESDNPAVGTVDHNGLFTAVSPGIAMIHASAGGKTGMSLVTVTETRASDTIAPIISLNGANPASVTVGSAYIDAGATATDNIDGDLTQAIQRISTVNVSAAGIYNVTYSVTDSSGNTSSIMRSVAVSGIPLADILPPVIVLLGESSVSLVVGSAYTDAGATAIDDMDGNLTASIVNTGLPINTGAPGEYVITYSVSDTSGNTSIAQRTVKVLQSASGSGSGIISGGGGGFGGGLIFPLQQNEIENNFQQEEVERQVERQREIEREFKESREAKVLGIRLDFRKIQLDQVELEAEILSEKGLDELLRNLGRNPEELKESSARAQFVNKLKQNANELSDDDENAIANFITYGTANTKKLGEGERAGVLDSYKSAFGKLPTTKEDWNDALKIAIGRFPGKTNAAAETRAKTEFKKIYLRDPDMADEKDKAAVTVMAYGLRPGNRNLNSEKAAIKIFRGIFKASPTNAMDWDKVRAIAYSGTKR